jgi:hypothetical protein
LEAQSLARARYLQMHPPNAAEALITPLAHALLREEHGKVDAALPAIIDAIKATGAAACWHKHSSFLSHLLGVHRIAALWALPRDVCLMALAHSAYSNRHAHRAVLVSRGLMRCAQLRQSGAVFAERRGPRGGGAPCGR